MVSRCEIWQGSGGVLGVNCEVCLVQGVNPAGGDLTTHVTSCGVCRPLQNVQLMCEASRRDF